MDPALTVTALLRVTVLPPPAKRASTRFPTVLAVQVLYIHIASNVEFEVLELVSRAANTRS